MASGRGQPHTTDQDVTQVHVQLSLPHHASPEGNGFDVEFQSQHARGPSQSKIKWHRLQPLQYLHGMTYKGMVCTYLSANRGIDLALLEITPLCSAQVNWLAAVAVLYLI